MSGPLKPRLEVIDTSNDGECAIVSLRDEDHTLANALRYVMVRSSGVKFFGYSTPHPNEPSVVLQIQMQSGLNAITALHKGLSDLMDVSQHIKHIFNQSLQRFQQNTQNS